MRKYDVRLPGLYTANGPLIEFAVQLRMCLLCCSLMGSPRICDCIHNVFRSTPRRVRNVAYTTRFSTGCQRPRDGRTVRYAPKVIGPMQLPSVRVSKGWTVSAGRVSFRRQQATTGPNGLSLDWRGPPCHIAKQAGCDGNRIDGFVVAREGVSKGARRATGQE